MIMIVGTDYQDLKSNTNMVMLFEICNTKNKFHDVLTHQMVSSGSRLIPLHSKLSTFLIGSNQHIRIIRFVNPPDTIFQFGIKTFCR